MPVSRAKTKAKKSLKTAEPALHNIALQDMKRFHRSVDWSAWWESFYLDISDSGTHKWKSIKQFAIAHSDNDKQCNFIQYVCGPKPPVIYVPEDFKFVEPMNWVERRRTGGWYTPENIKLLSQTIKSKMDGLEALRESGAVVTVNSLIRLEKIAQQIDADFGGSVMSPDLPFKANKERAELYLKLHKEVLMMSEIAQDMFAKSHGINFQTDTYAQIILAATSRAQIDAGPGRRSNSDKVLHKIIDMTLEKSTTHAITLPEDMKQTVVQVMEKSKVQ